MNDYFKQTILIATGASDLYEIETIQSLWSGYGTIKRYGLKNGMVETIIVKHVSMPTVAKHPRGWHTNLSHQRKVKSYDVETAWYRHWSYKCVESCRVPKCFVCESQADELLIILEDLDTVGYGARRTEVSIDEIKCCLRWLANFHAIFMHERPTHLWQIGTYWHLDTRPDELKVLDDLPLKNAASAIDQKLQTASYQTFVHGDAKLANFCFSNDGQNVAAVDFQYVGGGCGMKDVAYFIGSCLHDDACERYEKELLDFYFEILRQMLNKNDMGIDFNALEMEWRQLYRVCWADFHRFLKGWSPGHWKINAYSERLVRETLAML